MSDDLADLVRRSVEVRIIHHLAGSPTAQVAQEGGGFALKTVAGDEHYIVLAKGPWSRLALRGDGKTIEEAVRNLHD